MNRPEPGLDPILSKTDDFTVGRRGEVRTMQFWLQAAFAGELRLADTILTTGLRAEHYRSLLPNDLNDATSEQLATLEELTAALDAAIRMFNEWDRLRRDVRDEILRREGA
jgi:hypothetical protein